MKMTRQDRKCSLLEKFSSLKPTFVLHALFSHTIHCIDPTTFQPFYSLANAELIKYISAFDEPPADEKADCEEPPSFERHQAKQCN